MFQVMLEIIRKFADVAAVKGNYMLIYQFSFG